MIDEQTNVNNPEVETTQVNYIEAMAEMRKNMVSKEEYNKVLEENRQLVNTLATGGSIQVEQPEVLVDTDALKKELSSKEMTNLEYATKALQLRDELLKRGEKDPFLPNGHEYIPNDTDSQEAQRAADALQYCVDVADGDPHIFQTELQRILVDPILPRKSNNRR